MHGGSSQPKEGAISTKRSQKKPVNSACCQKTKSERPKHFAKKGKKREYTEKNEKKKKHRGAVKGVRTKKKHIVPKETIFQKWSR